MDLQELDRSVEFYFRNGLANSTQRSYNSAKKRYACFCRSKNITPLPASEHLLCRYVSTLADENLRHGTIKCYLSAIRHLHVAEGYGDPRVSSMARLEQVLKGIKMTQARKPGEKSLVRLPITPELLLKLKGSWSKEQGHDSIMLWAAVTLCFFGFLRSGEITVPSDSGFDEGAHLSFRDVAVDSLKDPTSLKIRIKASKTDPFRVGVDIYVGKTNNQLCPVTAMLAYLVIRGSGAGPLFKFQDGRPLTRVRLVTRVREALAAAGVDQAAYSGHSFRSGAATTAARQGIGDATIKMLGRWKSSAYQLYIQTPMEQLAAVSRHLVEGVTE